MGRGAVAFGGLRARFFRAWPQGTVAVPREGPMSSPAAPGRVRGQAWLAQCPASASAGGRSPSRRMSRSSLYQATQAAVIFSTSPRVAMGPSRNGDPSRTASDLYSPIRVSARALS